jgi:hypothetical protein
MSKDSPGYTLDDICLLHHFTNCTSANLSDRPEAHKTWATTVVQIAFAHPFLLQGILALAALHVGSLNTGEKEHLSILAASKHDAALTSKLRCHFRILLPCRVLHSCLCGYVINPAATFMEDDFFDVIVDWLRLLRDIRHLKA